MEDNVIVFEVWKVKNGCLFELVKVFSVYDDAWAWILSKDDSGGYVLRYINK